MQALGASAGGTEGADRQPDQRVVECVVDREGTMLPAVPVITARPNTPGDAELSALAAVLSSPLVSAWLWHAAAGTGLSARTVRLRPAVVAAVPWPGGALGPAIARYEAGDLAGSAGAVHAAYGIGASDGEHCCLVDVLGRRPLAA